jgi:hypothetical protein
MKLRALVIVLAGVVLAAGIPGKDASGADKADKEKGIKVQGRVTYQGKPLNGATLVFSPEKKGEPAVTGKTQEDGTYAVSGLKKGSYRIGISKVDGKTKKSLIPEKYGDPTTSGLVFEVIPGAQTIDIELK